MESSILEAMQREEVMTKHWDCKLTSRPTKKKFYTNSLIAQWPWRLAETQEGAPFIRNIRWVYPHIEPCKNYGGRR
jgi:hypothetical protein